MQGGAEFWGICAGCCTNGGEAQIWPCFPKSEVDQQTRAFFTGEVSVEMVIRIVWCEPWYALVGVFVRGSERGGGGEEGVLLPGA